MLDGYSTSPNNEVRKIWCVLNRKYNYTSLWVELHESFLISDLRSKEDSLDSFYSNFIVKNDNYVGLDDFEKGALFYRFFVELLLELLKYGLPNYPYSGFDNEIEQLKEIIYDGLKRCGYGIKTVNNKSVTYKLDIVAETVAASNKDYKEDIFNYLIAKTANEKENSLTNLSIKLEATKPFDGFSRGNRQLIQIMRHKKEKMEDKKYCWFFERKNYERNMDSLFKILICYISHIDCASLVEEFNKNILIKEDK